MGPSHGARPGQNCPLVLVKDCRSPARHFARTKRTFKEHLAAEGFENLTPAEYTERVEHLGTFMGIYFSLTSLHAIHVIVGIGVIFWILVGAIRRTFWQPILHARRYGWTLLAPGRYDLDLPFSASLSNSLSVT